MEKKPYRFEGGERIGLSESLKDFVHEQIVGTDGAIATPTGQIIKVLGKSLPEAQELVRKNIRKVTRKRDPHLILTLMQLPPRVVYVSGWVVSPKALQLPAGHPFDVLMALAAAGGAKPDAALTRVAIIRQRPTGKRKVTTIDATVRLSEYGIDQIPVLRSGDIVYVPRGERFVLVGEFVRPGVYGRSDVPSAVTARPLRASELIHAAGGLGPRANLSRLRRIRWSNHSGEESAHVDVFSFSNKGVDPDPVLRDGDCLVADATGGITILGQVRKPGIYYAEGARLTLSKLVAMAGGFERYARKGAVRVIKAKNPKEVKVVDVKAIINSGKQELDVELEAGDLVYVGERIL